MFTREQEPPALTQHRPTRRLAITAAAIIVLLSAGWWVRTTTTSEPEQVPAAAAPVEFTPATPPVTPKGQGCAKFTHPPLTPQDANVTWTTIGNTPAPSAPGVGPANTLPVRWCYAHTTPGALFAVINFVAQMTTFDPTVGANYLLADTPARTQVLTAAAQNRNPPTVTASSEVLQWVGYHLVDATPSTVTFDVLHRWGGQLTAATYTVKWENGSWLLAYPPGLMFEQRIVPTADPSYFQLWGDPQ